MDYNNANSLNPVLLKYLYDITPEELITINSRTQGFGDDELTHFCMIYRSKEKTRKLFYYYACLVLFL